MGFKKRSKESVKVETTAKANKAGTYSVVSLLTCRKSMDKRDPRREGESFPVDASLFQSSVDVVG